MIKILEQPKPFICKCFKCGCKFEYEYEDIITTTPIYEVECPVCKQLIAHTVSSSSCEYPISNLPTTITAPADMPDLKITYNFDE